MESAVDWLLNEVQGQGWGFIKVSIPKEVIHQAKTKEYQLVEKAIEFGLLVESDVVKFDYDKYCTLLEQFYAEELKSEKVNLKVNSDHTAIEHLKNIYYSKGFLTEYDFETAKQFQTELDQIERS